MKFAPMMNAMSGARAVRKWLSWLSARWPAACLTLIVVGSSLLALRWVFLVPIYQAPDEPAHLDYAFWIADHGANAVRRHELPPPRPYRINDLVHPYSLYLAEQVQFYRPPLAIDRLPPDYGTRKFYRAVNRGTPATGEARKDAKPPLGLTIYPQGYYTPLAYWIKFLRLWTKKIVVLFFGARVFSVFLLACTLPVVYATARELRHSRAASLILTAAIGCFPLTSYVASYVQPDNLCFLLVTLCWYTALLARRLGTTRAYGFLGLTLGAMLATKHHQYVCVCVPILFMLAVHGMATPIARTRALRRLALIAVPSIIVLALQPHFPWLANTSVFGRTVPLTLGSVLLGGRNALFNYAAGNAHETFWSVFGWPHVPIQFGTTLKTAVVEWLVLGGVWFTIALALFRAEQVVSRLLRIARAGRWHIALRLAASNVVLNSFALFVAMMFYVYIRTDNSFVAQGRQWYPFLMPMFLLALFHAPKALTLRSARIACSAMLTAGLLLYCGFGSYYSFKTTKHRYYPLPSAAATAPAAAPRG